MDFRDSRVNSGPAGLVALILGIVGLIGQLLTLMAGGIFLPMCLAAWALGQREVQKLQALGVPLGDLTQARAGHVLGVIGVVFSIVAAIGWMFLIGMLVIQMAGERSSWMLITDY
jgi:hypothetical protein